MTRARMIVTSGALLLLVLLLSGCGLLGSTASAYGGSPIARATNGASATFTMTTCAPTAQRERAVEETLVQLNQQGILALADGSGTAVRVSLNLCGAGPAPAAQAARR
jgi:hypothetical protein